MKNQRRNEPDTFDVVSEQIAFNKPQNGQNPRHAHSDIFGNIYSHVLILYIFNNICSHALNSNITDKTGQAIEKKSAVVKTEDIAL